MFSLVAKDKKAVQKFVAENINKLPGVLRTDITAIKRQHRIAFKEAWKLYVKSHLLPKV